jgi:hypothetical protein
MGTTPPSTTHYRGGLTLPVILIVLGLMLLFDQLVPGWGIGKTWPALLVTIGILKLIDVTRPPRPPEGPRV